MGRASDSRLARLSRRIAGARSERQYGRSSTGTTGVDHPGATFLRDAHGAGLWPRRVRPRRSRLRHLDRAPFVAGPGNSTARGRILGQPDQCGHGPTSRPPGRDRRCGPARDRSRRGRHARRGGGEGTGTRQHQVCHRLLETRDLLRSMRPAGYERRPYRMAFEPLRGRRDLTPRGSGPLPIHECPCDIGVVVHENRARM